MMIVLESVVAIRRGKLLVVHHPVRVGRRELFGVDGVRVHFDAAAWLLNGRRSLPVRLHRALKGDFVTWTTIDATAWFTPKILVNIFKLESGCAEF